MREFLVALNARFTSIIEKGLLLGGLIKSYGANWPFTADKLKRWCAKPVLRHFVTNTLTITNILTYVLGYVQTIQDSFCAATKKKKYRIGLLFTQTSTVVAARSCAAPISY